MPRPLRTPIGLQLTRVSKTVSRAFDDALAAAGGSVPVWLVLLSLKTQDAANQREAGEATFLRLRGAAVGFDERLRAGLSDTEVADLDRLLDRLADNVTRWPAE